MTRRDTIIIATLVNAALIACLFVTATREEAPKPPAIIQAPIAEVDPELNHPEERLALNDVVAEETLSSLNTQNDDVDQALKEFLPEMSAQPEPALAKEEIDTELKPEPVKPEPVPVKIVQQEKPASQSSGTIVEVTVKRGDMLEKIAKANGTTVQAIKKANQLEGDKLKIGQVLKIPVTKKVADAQPAKKPAPQTSSEPVYYTIKSGDNPWKIAKQFQVKFEDILKLNDMSEEKAKNLKVGDKIRVK